MACGSSILRCLIGIFNSIVALFGVTCIALGAIVLKNEDLETIPSDISTDGIKNGSIIMILVGSLILFIALLACCGAMMENKCMLLTYAIFVSAFIVLQLVASVFVWKNYSKFDDALKESLAESLQQNDKVTRDFFNTVQKTWKCCGVESILDYSNGPTPTSCINPESSEPYKEGCYTKLKSELKRLSNTLGGLFIGLVGIEIVNLVAVLALFCLLRKTVSGFS